MNRWIVLAAIVVLVTACGSEPSWQDEASVKVSDRILADDVEMLWSLLDEDKRKQDGVMTVRLEIMKRDGERIEDYAVTHEKLLHLMIISKDLSYFRHVHPEYIGNGVFEIGQEFPFGGEYRLIADYKPERGDSMTKMAWVLAEGERAAPVPVTPSPVWESVVDGKRVALSIDELAAGRQITLGFRLAHEADGAPITDLEPYLGAIGHVVVLSEDGERYLHVHAQDDQGTGPAALFETEFPRSGVYKIWGQFQRAGEVFTVSYVVDVP